MRYLGFIVELRPEGYIVTGIEGRRRAEQGSSETPDRNEPTADDLAYLKEHGCWRATDIARERYGFTSPEPRKREPAS